MNTDKTPVSSDHYKDTLQAILERVRAAQYKALQSVNRELIALYWDIGRVIVERQEQQHWGDNVIKRLAKDLQIEFPGIRGFSISNLWNMRKFYLAYRNNEKLQSVTGEISWTHNVLILDKCKGAQEAEFYLRAASQYAWSVRTLEQQITSKSYQRSLTNQTNFTSTLPKDQSAKAVQTVKDDYNFDFLTLTEPFKERELEDALVANITAFLAEMGGYFAFVGRQVKVEVRGKEFFIDILFYHRKLRCLVAIDLKTVPFEPEHAGKMQFYLSALDKQVRLEEENPSIGIIICKEKDRTVVEYTLQDVTRPIGVATYNQYSSLKELPAELRPYLPSEEELDERLSG